ncbi:hypothetical protein BDD12DRAFT_19149 [Trichophaea hybrida]|nr:hypothetical protein BDD12DRAFT_19149 [Trichophaea hybrida]
MDSDVEDSGSVSGNEDEDHHMEEEEDEEEEEEEEAKTSVDNETKTTQVPENKEANSNVTKTTEPATVPSSEPSSPPDVMSSKRINVWAGFPVRESASVLPPIGRLPPSPSDTPVRLGLNPQQQMQQHQQHQQPYQRNMANMASGPRWVPNNRSSNPNVDGILAGYMDSKKEFFDARAKNFARVSAELNLGTDHPPAHSVLYPRAQWTDPELHQCTPLRPVPDWYRDLKSENGNSLLSPSVPKANGPTPKGQTTTTEENLFARQTKTIKFWDKKESLETMETKVQEVENDKEKNEEEDAGAASTKSAADTDICDEDGDYDDEGDYEVGDYYCELESEDEDTGISDELDDIFDDEPTNFNQKVPTLKTQGDGNHKTGYSKFSIDDMMNHESPKGKTRSLETAVLASPPLAKALRILPAIPLKSPRPYLLWRIFLTQPHPPQPHPQHPHLR